MKRKIYRTLTIFMAILASLFFSTIGYANNIRLISTYPSDPQAFTQGLEKFNGNELLLATGLYGKSTIGLLNIHSGKYKIFDKLDNRYFGEGVTITPYGVWQLTWKENTAFLRNAEDFSVIKQVHYNGEGWGLAYDPTRKTVWMSNGSDKLQQRDAQTFELLSEISVGYQGAPIYQINELEFANQSIYANIWQTNYIVKIDPNTGNINHIYDMTPLLNQADLTPIQRSMMDVLNGIAHIADNRFYLTGKHYPIIFEVELLP